MYGARLFNQILLISNIILKEYYEIVNGSPSSIEIVPHRCRFCLQKYISNHETKQSASFRAIPALIASQSTF